MSIHATPTAIMMVKPDGLNQLKTLSEKRDVLPRWSRLSHIYNVPTNIITIVSKKFQCGRHIMKKSILKKIKKQKIITNLNVRVGLICGDVGVRKWDTY